MPVSIPISAAGDSPVQLAPPFAPLREGPPAQLSASHLAVCAAIWQMTEEMLLLTSWPIPHRDEAALRVHQHHSPVAGQAALIDPRLGDRDAARAFHRIDGKAGDLHVSHPVISSMNRSST